MSIQRKIATGIIKQRDTRAINQDGITTTQTWIGPYTELLIKQNSIIGSAKSSNLSPTDAGDGSLTITYETPPATEAPAPDVLELTWAELRLPVQDHHAFEGITAARKKIIREESEKEDTIPPTDATELKLYNLLIAGTTEYAIGSPVVRRTRQLRAAPGGGSSWIREEPPALAPDGYEWLKTANETRKEGRTYTHTEEWTGAKKWDTVLYPAVP